MYCYIWLGLGKAAGNAGLEQESKEGQEVHLRQRIRTGVHKPGNIRGNYQGKYPSGVRNCHFVFISKKCPFFT